MVTKTFSGHAARQTYSLCLWPPLSARGYINTASNNNNHFTKGSKAPLGEKEDGGEGLNNHRNRDVGFLAALRTMLFGARDPESDLSIEMLEELHMVTGCK